MLLAVLIGCQAVDPAPTDLDALTHFFYLEFDSPEEGRLVEGLDNLRTIWNREGNIIGGLTTVDAEHRRAVGMSGDADFSAIYGVFELVDRSGCSAEELGQMYMFTDQASLFPGRYEDYSRSYDDNRSCFLDQSCDRMEYSVAISQKILGKSIEYEIVGQLRRLRDDEGDSEGILVRSHMPQPARVGGASDGPNGSDQNYQIEVFLPQKGRSHVHHYGAWSAGRLVGFGPEAEDFWSQRYLSAVEEWNDELDRLCTDDKALWQ